MLLQCFRRDITRISRVDYCITWFSALLFFGLLDVLLFACWQTFEMDVFFLVIFLGIKLFQVIYMYLLTLKRFHDVGYAAWCLNVCVLLSLLVIGNFLILLVVTKESDGKNAWGESPLLDKYEKTVQFTEDKGKGYV